MKLNKRCRPSLPSAGALKGADASGQKSGLPGPISMAGGRVGRLVIPGLLLLLVLAGCGGLYRWVGGDFAGPPAQLPAALSPGAQKLLQDSFRDLDPRLLADIHVHVIGRQGDGSGSISTKSTVTIPCCSTSW